MIHDLYIMINYCMTFCFFFLFVFAAKEKKQLLNIGVSKILLPHTFLL